MARRQAPVSRGKAPTEREKIRAGWEGASMFADVVAGVDAAAPLDDAARAQALESVTKGYGETIANAVVAAADAYFDDEYPAMLRAWWLAVARELRGRTAQDDRALKRIGVGTLGRVLL